MDNKKQAAIELKLSKAKLLLAEVPLLQQHRLNATIINRLYYACYHATKALLLIKDLVPKTHSGVVAMLHRHYVAAGTFEMPKAAFYSRLLQQRMEGDYSDLLYVDDEIVNELIIPAQEYINYIEKQIQKEI